MKTIGLLGGTGWSSTIRYYTQINQEVNKRLGGFHSGEILLRSIDYHEIMSQYGKDHNYTSMILANRLKKLSNLEPDCIIICCNSLHKYYDLISKDLNLKTPIMHALELTAEEVKFNSYNKVFLIAAFFTMEDGFFQASLENNGVQSIIPNQAERKKIHHIHLELMENKVTQESRDYFSKLILSYSSEADAVILGCTEFALAINQDSSVLPIIDPVDLQVSSAVDFSLGDSSSAHGDEL